ncbi:MAG: hypothetical protein GF331_01635 [Chitinivibrionales bacterium]|nr:hypothetical protein [Chitinivibrionales bacterium]
MASYNGRHLKALCIALCISSVSMAQGLGDWGENTDPFLPPKTGWIADSLFLGATFLRDTSRSFRVWLHRNEAGCMGRLFLMVPNGATDGSDTAIYLFQNKNNSGPTSIELGDDSLVNAHIGHLDTLFFMYQVDEGAWCSDKDPRYTGPNRREGDGSSQGAPDTGYSGFDRYTSNSYTTSQVSAPDGSTYPIGRRWCVAGWIRDNVNNARTDTVEFGFEDLTPGDADFDDIVFHLTGAFLIRPAVLRDIRLDAEPDTGTIIAGDTISYYATVMVDSTTDSGFHVIMEDTIRSNQVIWEIEDTPPGAVLVNGPGPIRANSFTATRAHQTYYIVATIVDSLTGQILRKRLEVNVIPDDPYQLVIEGAADTLSGLDLQIPNPITTLTIPSAANSDSVYAIVRDQYGNYTNNCANTGWAIVSGASIVEVAEGRTGLGEAVISERGPAGSAVVRAWDEDHAGDILYRDTIDVVIDPASYDGLRFVVGTGGQKRVITSLDIHLTRDTLLRAEAHRTDGVGGDDNDGWVSQDVQWQAPAGIGVDVPAPASAREWTFRPTNTGTGDIRISYAGRHEDLPVSVTTGTPERIVLYAREGDPDAAGTDPYQGPALYTYSWNAGRDIPLVGKVFDEFGTWLEEYETDPAMSQNIHWQVRLAGGGAAPADIGTFSAADGHAVDFTPMRAYTTVDLIGTHNDGQHVFRDTVRIRILPGQIDHLVIEPTPDSTVSPNDDNRLGQIEMQHTSGELSVYGILRDAYGNFVMHADSTQWLSRDVSVVTADIGPNPAQGEGVITRQSTVDAHTWVVASRGAFRDSVRVDINAVSYDAIRVYVIESGVHPVSEITMRTDEDTTLRAQGRRADNGLWEDISVSWSSSGLGFTSAAPDYDAQFWLTSPDDTGSGTVTISHNDASGNKAYSVTVNAVPGLPHAVTIYPAGGATPIPENHITGTITAGNDTVLVARVFDHNGVLLSPSTAVSWSRAMVSGNLPPGSLTASGLDTARFSSTAAHKTVDITATYGGIGYTVRFRVVPDTPSALYVENSPAPTGAALNQPGELANITLSATDTTEYAYAVLRDQHGNFVSASPRTDWTSLNAAIVTVTESNPGNGEGRIHREGDEGETRVVAVNRDNSALRDTLPVILSPITYVDLQIAVNAGGVVHLDTLSMRGDQDTTLFALGQRSDNGGWDQIPVEWSSLGLSTDPDAPVSADEWSFSPLSADTGTIVVTRGTGGNALSDTIVAFFTTGRPAQLRLYPSAGAPGGAGGSRYPDPGDTISLTAGTPFPCVAKLFDDDGTWLSVYETPSAPILWRIVERAGTPPTGTPTPPSGHATSLVCTTASNVAYLIAEFEENGIELTDTVQLAITADSIYQLVIEASANVNPNTPAPVFTAEISGSDTAISVYAVLRDQYGNFVDYSRSTTWRLVQPADTNIARVKSGVASLGEGVILRDTTVGQTRLFALDNDHVIIDSTDTANIDTIRLVDTIRVVLNQIFFTELQVVVSTPTVDSIDSLVIRLDQDTTLEALGRRSDNGRMMNVRVNWTGPSFSVTPAAPTNAFSWPDFSPSDTGSSFIVASRVGESDTLRDTVWVQAQAGRPSRLELYPKLGTPETADNARYPNRTIADTVAAGRQVPLVAKLFDERGVPLGWLSGLEQGSLPVSWQLVEVSGSPPTGSLTSLNGNTTQFLPLRAHNAVRISATYSQGGIVLSDTVTFYVVPGAPHHLVIEASSNRDASPHQDNPADQIVMVRTDTIAHAYAILRDSLGNFVGYAGNVAGYSDECVWSSLDTAVADAEVGLASIGEGRAVRRSDTGQVYLTAHDPANPQWRDTVLVVLESITFTDLYIADELGDTSLSGLTAPTDTGQITLLVFGRRSDNGHLAQVAARWHSSGSLSVSPAAPSAAETWSFAPSDTGRGRIWVSMGDAVGDTIDIVFEPGSPLSLVLYPDEGMPAPGNPENRPYEPPSMQQTISAGDTLTVIAKLFDHQSIWLSQYEVSSADIAWTIEEIAGNELADSLSDTAGHRTSFNPTEALRQVHIIATFTDGLVTLRDTVGVSVQAGPPDHLVIEPNQNWWTSAGKDNPIDTVTITSIEQDRHVYAIVRDRHGNFVDYSQVTSWYNTSGDSIVSVEAGIASKGQGVIRREYDFSTSTDTMKHTLVYAVSEQYAGLADTVDVILLKLWFDSLRIVRGDTAIDSLEIETDDQVTLRAQGRRGDNGDWIELQVSWETSDGLSQKVSPPPPEFSKTWEFSPTRPDTTWTSWIRITLGVDSVSRPDTLPVYFRRSPPSVVLVDILTPRQLRIAGDTIEALVRVRNQDGLVPGVYCVSGDSGAAYWNATTLPDNLRPALMPPDTVVTEQDVSLVNPPGDIGSQVDQCFVDGEATVKIVLHNAPYNPVDSLARIGVDINGAIGYSDAFPLHPGALATMRLEDGHGAPYGDTLRMSFPNDFALFVARGYDQFGNRRDKEMSLWETTGLIPEPSLAEGRQVFYMINTATDNHQGHIIATTMDTSTAPMSDSVYVIITDHLAQAQGAETRDSDGDGFLDRLVIRFDKSMQFENGFDPRDNILVQYRDSTLTLDQDTSWTYGENDSVIVLRLEEPRIEGDARFDPRSYQTAWEPTVTGDFGGLAFHDTLTCEDRAGPVIVVVRKTLKSAFDRSKDEVSVLFSEPVSSRGLLGEMGLSTPPDTLFNVFDSDDTGFVLLEQFLDDIDGLAGLQSNTDSVRFRMENEMDLMTHHYLNIRTYAPDTSQPALFDNTDEGNPPHPNNRRAPVLLSRAPPSQVNPWPNPARPSTRYDDPGELNLEDIGQAEAIRRAESGEGLIFMFPLTQPSSGFSAPVEARMKIYDMAGNLVQEAFNPDIVGEGSSEDRSVYNMHIYWNGTNQRGAPVAPGVYRFVIFLDYTDSVVFDTKLFGNVGIRR